MTETPLKSPAHWEREVREELRGHRLVGELRVTEDDFEAIENQVRGLVGSGLSARGLALSYPALLVAYLTNVGIYRYQAGTYWPHVPFARRLEAQTLGPAFKH